MESVIGIFKSRQSAKAALQRLHSLGMPDHAIVLLTARWGEEKLAALPASNAEATGVGKATGEKAGGAIGSGIGLGAGGAIVSLFVPGTGPLIAAGFGGAALLGAGGAVAGAILARKSETALDMDVPREDIAVYHGLLRQGRSMIVALARNAQLESMIRDVLSQHGAEDIGRARKTWEIAPANQAA